eukprot:1223556-Prymnesium_polylepis.1
MSGYDNSAGVQLGAPPLEGAIPLGEHVAAGAWALQGGEGGAGGAREGARRFGRIGVPESPGTLSCVG